MNNDFDNNQPNENNQQPPVEQVNQPQQEQISQEPQQQAYQQEAQQQQAYQQEAQQTYQQEAQQQTYQQEAQQQTYQQPYQNTYYEQKHYFPNGYQVNQGGFYTPPTNKSPNNNGKKGFKIFVILLSAVLLFTIGTGVGKLIHSIDVENSPKSGSEDTLKYKGEDIEVESGESVKNDSIKPDANGKYTADQVARLVGDSVVNILVYSTTDSSSTATASGVILNNKGYIITNDHIYSSITNAKFVVTMNDGTSHKASFVAGDQRSDIAVLKFDETPKNLVAATFANSSEITAGEDVIAIGSPNGLSGTITKGIVSYPSRRITASSSDSTQATANYSMRVIQTDAALNPGNSGGALVNMYGQVVGINSSKLATTGYEGICFAIPSNDAIKYAKSLVKNGEVIGRAKLGITYLSISSATALVNNIPEGLRISSIDSNSELSKKGITTGENGDIITKVNGKAITNSDIVLDIIDDSVAGDEITLTIYSVSKKTSRNYTVKLLEAASTASYKNEIPKSTTASPYGSGNTNPYDYQNPFSFGE